LIADSTAGPNGWGPLWMPLHPLDAGRRTPNAPNDRLGRVDACCCVWNLGPRRLSIARQPNHLPPTNLRTVSNWQTGDILIGRPHMENRLDSGLDIGKATLHSP
jgi:hypothetical protein